MPLILPTKDGGLENYPMDEKVIGFVCDGYHTFNELYAHRIALFLALCRALQMGWKSKIHADGTSYEGWFIAGITLPMVGTISYHLPLEEWEHADHLQTLERARAWDGHTANDVVERLILYAVLEDAGV